MGMDASWPLQQAVITELSNSEALTQLMGAPPPVFDKPQPRDVLPRIEIGDSECKSWRSATFDGQEHALSLQLWTGDGGSGVSKEIASLIISHLHDADLPLPGHALVDMQFESSETRHLLETIRPNKQDGEQDEKGAGENADSGHYHCLLQFSALTVSD